jgi:hypothetical protein
LASDPVVDVMIQIILIAASLWCFGIFMAACFKEEDDNGDW